MRQAYVHRISTRSPDDVTGLTAMVARGDIRAENIVAILGKTEGNGCVNDFTRGFASLALKQALLAMMPRDLAQQVCIVMSGGTEGALAPHLVVFEVRQADGGADNQALAIGRAQTPALPFAALGRSGQVDMVAKGVRAAMRDAGIANPDDVHFVQIKCPLLTLERIAQAQAAGATTATRDTLKSMGLSRAASALGAGVALGEIARHTLNDDMIGRDWSAYSARASGSAGVELFGHDIVVLGTAPGWCGPLRIAHAVMADAIDIAPVGLAMAALGLPDRSRLIAVLAKAEASSTGLLRGHRHTMLDDSDISATRHARGFVAGALASLVGHAEIYVSGGAEHQGPDGGGPVAIIAEREALATGTAA